MQCCGMGQRTKLQIISRLWDHVTDLLLMCNGKSEKTMEQIEQEIDLTEYYCRPYADCDDDELYTLDVLRAAKETKGRGGDIR